MNAKKLASLAVILLSACGPAQTQESPKTAAATEKPAAEKKSDLPPVVHSVALTRSQVKTAVTEGLGAFLQNVELDDNAVFVDGKFHGFRILGLRGSLVTSGIEPGDVVVSLNKMPIERPEQALAAFRSLENATEIRVDYEHNGEPKTLAMPILDDGTPKSSATASPPSAPN